MDTLMQDLRYAARQMLRAPAFTALAVATLALGTGANTALFTLADALLLRPAAGVAAPGELVWVSAMERGGHPGWLSYPDFRDVRDGTAAVFSGVAAFHDAEMSLSGGGEPARVQGALVSGGFFAVLGTRLERGRGITVDDDRAGAPAVAVISHALWQGRFGGDPGVLGRAIVVDGAPATVVGVAPEGFNGADRDLQRQVWLPLATTPRAMPGEPDLLTQRSAWWLRTVARLRPGVGRARADAAVAVVAAQIQRADAQWHQGRGMRTFSARYGLHPGEAGQVLGLASMAFAVTGLVMLIACANVSSLLLGRAVARRREIGIRLSLGAGRRRVLRQLLTESVVLAALATAAGLLAAVWGVEALAAAVVLPPMDVRPDVGVLAFCTAAALVASLLFGTAPALHATRADVATALRDAAAGPNRRSAGLQSRLVVAQVALSLVLLAASGLLLRSLAAESRVNVGFDASDRVLALSFDLGLQGYSADRARAFVDALGEGAQGLPGVQSVSFTTQPPMAGARVGTEATPEGGTAGAGDAPPVEVMLAQVRPRYFQTVGIPLLRGRDFTAADAPGAPPVAVVSEAMARAAWPDGDAVGRRIRVLGMDGLVTVVGVAREAVLSSVYEPAHPALYLPQLQQGGGALTLVVRTAGDARPLAAALRRQVRALDPDLPVHDVRTLGAYRRDSMSPARTAARLVGLFGALALLLAAGGLYGVMAFAVSQRTREIGVRVALGARPGEVTRLFVRRGMRLAGVGILVGLALAAGVGRLLAGMLYGLAAVDAPALAAVCALLAAVAALAAWLPARRAARVDAMVALRAE